MRRFVCTVSLFTILFALSNAFAQQSSSQSVPSLITYSGTIRDANAAGSSRTLGVTFAIYQQPEGGAPLWMETQNTMVSANGHYTVLLGSTSATGLPSDLFSPAEPRWLGVQVEGQPEQPRVLLVSVPYAMKAAEADTLAGHSLSEFVTADILQSAVKDQLQQQGSTARAGGTTAVIGSTNSSTASPYIDNGTTQQVGASFNIDGTGTAANFNVTNQYMLAGAPFLGTSSGGSLFLGPSAGQSNTGTANIFIGPNAGLVNSTGANNMFVGPYSGQRNTTGSQNTFVGGLTGVSNTTGAANAFFGNSAGYHTTTGSYNMFFGVNAGFANTIGFGNSFVGVQAGLSNVSGNENLFLGSNSGQNSNGSFNTFIGSSAGTGNTTGNNNTVIGTAAGQPLVSGNQNTFLGSNAGSNANPSGSNNVYLNSPGNTGDNGTIRIGDPSTQNAAYIAGVTGASTSSGVPVFIDPTGKLGTSGSTTGLVTSVFGRSGNVTPQFGDYNFGQISGGLLGSQLGGPYTNSVDLSNPTNMFNGTFSGNGSSLSGVMPAPGSSNYIQNTNSPQGANFNVSGNGTVGGLFTAQSGLQAFNNMASNVAVEAVDNNTSGQSAGIEAKTFNPTGTGVDGHAKATTGYSVGVQGQNDSTIGAGVLGYNSTSSGQNYGVLGYTQSTGGYGVMGASASVGTAGSNQTCTTFGSCTLTTGVAGQFFTETGGTILQGLSGANLTSLAQVFAVDSSGNVTTAGSVTAPGVHSTTVTGGVAVFVDSTGHLGVATSSARFKDQIRDMGDSSSALMKLRPVTYFYRPAYDDGTRTLQYGLIAEEVAQVYPELVAYEPDGRPYTVKYQYLATMLLNELQKEHRKVEELSAELQVRNAELKKQNEQMQQRLTRLEELLQSQNSSVVAQTVFAVSAQPGGTQK